VSATGIYVETDADVGPPGTVHWLELATKSRERKMRAMAYVVRRVTLEDLDQRSRSGVAFAFMPESEAAAEELCEFVTYVVERRSAPPPREAGAEPRAQREEESAPSMSARAPASVGSERRGATLQKLSVRSMTLETSWPVEQGEQLRVDIVPPSRATPLRLTGRAESVVLLSGTTETRYRIQISITEDHEPNRDEVGDTLDQIFSSFIHPSAERGSMAPARELSGLLSRVRLPTLLSLFELERMSGRLVVRGEAEVATVFVHGGLVVDVEQKPPREPREALRALFRWTEGAFEFYAEEVSRPNVLGMNTTALLLDLAREEDESNRNRSDTDIDELIL
jgi:hypothetical protein